MKHIARLMLLTLGVGVVAVVVSSLSRHTAAAASDPPSLPVHVTNTPLPVNANITNTAVPVTGSVNAVVTGTVGINSLPPVTFNGAQPVSVTFPSSITVQTPAGTTHLGQDVTNLVTLVTSSTFVLANTDCAGFFARIPPSGVAPLPNSGPTACYTLPSASYLVITDIDYQCISGAPGAFVNPQLDYGVYFNPNLVLDSTGSVQFHQHYTTGFVLDHAPITTKLNCSGDYWQMVLQGYTTT